MADSRTSATTKSPKGSARPKGPSLFSLLRPYRGLIAMLLLLTVASNALGLALPKIVANAIDGYGHGAWRVETLFFEFLTIAVLVFVLTYLLNIAQTYASERVAFDMRKQLASKISEQEYAYIQKATPAKLLTNLTSDIDAIKTFVSQAITSIISSVFLIFGASVLLLYIDWKLALVVLAVVPFVAAMITVVLRRVRKLFRKVQEAIDWLNRIINESIFGAALVRLQNSQQFEFQKFLAANAQARDLGLGILRLFAMMIPVITLASNVATLSILTIGGHFVITGAMTLGDFTAFNSYLAILIFPIFIIGFMSNVIAQAQASYSRVAEIMHCETRKKAGNLQAVAGGDLSLKGITVIFGNRSALKNVSMTVKAGTKTAIIGPTAAGKTQLLYLLTGLIEPTLGTVEYAGRAIADYDPVSLHRQIGFVFQDSVIFNLTVRENIAFSNTVNDADLAKAIETAELADFIDALPDKLDTVVSERGTSLSGGQKQRIMLARALALNPSVLLLDDFTARVDTRTERSILENVRKNYPGITLISVTQKVATVEDYDQIVVLMEGDMLASGTHEQLMKTSNDYVLIHDSQRSTNAYELHAE